MNSVLRIRLFFLFLYFSYYFMLKYSELLGQREVHGKEQSLKTITRTQCLIAHCCFCSVTELGQK